MLTYFDLKVDPFQLRNLLYTLTGKSIYFWIKNNCLLLDVDLNYMHRQVTQLRNYSGEEEVPGEEIKEAEVAEEQGKASQDEKAEEETKNTR